MSWYRSFGDTRWSFLNDLNDRRAIARLSAAPQLFLARAIFTLFTTNTIISNDETWSRQSEMR